MKKVIITILKKINLYDFFKSTKDEMIIKSKLSKKYKFEGKIKNKEKLCIILAGYKEFLYDNLFRRVKKYVPDDVEICILSSGKYSDKLSKIAKENDWSYLSIKRNNVCLIQNIAINLFKKANYIYKIDEDISITKNSFDIMYKTLNDCQNNGEYDVGFVAPTIPVNGFAHILVLERFNLIKTYTDKFERPVHSASSKMMVVSNPEVAKFFWGEGGYLPNIDEMNKIVNKDKFEYVACPIRFSIGAILFTREFWKAMGMFDVKRGSGMGKDEEKICCYCMNSSKAIIISKNTIVGHLSFGKQNETMKKYFKEKIEKLDA